MNFVTADKAVCIFPFHTLIRRASYVTARSQARLDTEESWYIKYRSRGFTMLHHGIRVTTCKPWKRVVGDRYCLTVTFQGKLLCLGIWYIFLPDIDFLRRICR